jgi:hypothetical protein
MQSASVVIINSPLAALIPASIAFFFEENGDEISGRMETRFERLKVFIFSAVLSSE